MERLAIAILLFFVAGLHQVTSGEYRLNNCHVFCLFTINLGLLLSYRFRQNIGQKVP